MSSRRTRSPVFSQKRTAAIKRADGEPLTRADIQYDVLYHIFHDTHNVFTDPFPSDGESPVKVCFLDLYIKTILHSPRATRALKDKIMVSREFAEDFGMLALLVNVGRVNTTMSFFPEMKTVIRTYHPIPVLQRTTGNLQDAPRIKNILKSTVLRNEAGATPTTPTDIIERLNDGHLPPTTVTNLIFVLANHSAPIGHNHFSGSLDFVDLFVQENVSSLSRARAFLWLCYHYLESPFNKDDYDGKRSGNPFDGSRRHDAPSFTFLSDSEIAEENVDTADEKMLGDILVSQRTDILKAQGTKESHKVSHKDLGAEGETSEDDEPISVSDETVSRGKRSVTRLIPPAKKKASSQSLCLEVEEQERQQSVEVRSTDAHFSRDQSGTGISWRQVRRRYERQSKIESAQTPIQSSESYGPHHRRTYSLRGNHFAVDSLSNSRKRLSKLRTFRDVSQPPSRSFLHQAWRFVSTTDALVDSDAEVGDERALQDYVRRLHIIDAFYGKELSAPESEQVNME